jgi:hypothetical protein
MRELSNRAYERELQLEMKKLAEQFKLWQDNQIDVWDLEQAVHKFHNGAARELYKRYTMLKPDEVLPYALFKNIITYEELPIEIVEEMKMIVSILYNYDRNRQEYFDETE